MSIKESNEITVKIKGSLENFQKFLNENGYVETYRFSLEDTYFVPKDIDFESMSTRDIIATAILVRDIQRKDICQSPKLTFKKKVINENGEILSQEATSCTIIDVEEAKGFLEVIGYKKLMVIKEYDVAYEKNGLKLETKDIVGGEKLIEIETNSEGEFTTIDSIKKKILEEEIPIYTDNFFVKKAEVELDRILGRD